MYKILILVYCGWERLSKMSQDKPWELCPNKIQEITKKAFGCTI
jgi:hypothetical protein